MDAHCEQRWIVDRATAEAERTSHKTSNEAKSGQLSERVSAEFYIAICIVDIVLHLQVLLSLVDTDGDQGHTGANHDKEGLEVELIRRTRLDAEDGWAARRWHDKIHENDASEHAAANRLLNRLLVTFLPLHNRFKLSEFLICASILP